MPAVMSWPCSAQTASSAGGADWHLNPLEVASDAQWFHIARRRIGLSGFKPLADAVLTKISCTSSAVNAVEKPPVAAIVQGSAIVVAVVAPLVVAMMTTGRRPADDT